MDHTWTVKCEAIGKCKSDVSPYLIANEWIAANIGQFLRLPVPPFSIVRKKSRSTVMFASYSFEGETTPADSDPQAVHEKWPELSAGIVLFDILVASSDRTNWNIKVDKPVNPKSLYIIDHERALFYVYPQEGVERLNTRRNRLGLSGTADSSGQSHCLIELLDSVGDLEVWIDRIRSIPDWFLREVCEDVWKVAITRDECNAVIEFLKSRRDELGTLVLNHKARFPGIQNWPMFL